MLWWGLSCSPALRALFVLLYYAAGAACIWAALRADTALKRGLPLLLLLAVRLGSFVARGLARGGLDAGLRHYLWMEACSLMGGIINAARVPERWFQPKDPRVRAGGSGSGGCWGPAGQAWRGCTGLPAAGAGPAGPQGPPSNPPPCPLPQLPAPLDYVFNSHQLMHVLVAASLWHLHAGAAADHLLTGLQQC